MKPNRLKARLANDELALGLMIPVPDPSLVEYAATAGMDFVRFDCENGPMSLETIEHMVRAAEAVDITPIVKVSTITPEIAVQMLNRGANGLVFPHIATAAQAADAARFSRFPPEGDRVLTGSEGHVRWTLGLPASGKLSFANRETTVTCLVEDAQGIANIDEICAQPGVDIVMFGTGDLSGSLGHPHETHHPEVQEAVRRGIKAAREHGKAAAVSIHGTADAPELAAHIDLGVRVIDIIAGPFLIHSLRVVLEELRTLKAPEARHVP